MHQITIRLPCNRDYTGTLKLEDAKGKLVAGPFKICARAHDELARANGNPDRLPVLPFGDMPLGEYQITQIVPSGPGTPYDGDEFGSAGIVFLQPRHGEAVLADANGRFIFLIHGGALARNGALRPTHDGSLRLSNRDQRKLVGVLRRVGTVACRCIVTNSGSAKHRVAAAGSARSTRAPARGGAAAAGLAETSRRSWLRTMLIAAGAFASVPSLLLFSSPKAYGEGGGTDYSPKEDLDKYQDQLKQAQDAAAQAQADYEKQKETNPNANMAPMLDAEGKVQGLQDMVRYEQQQAAQQSQPATTTEPTNENPTTTTTNTTEPTTTEPNNENPTDIPPPTVTEPTNGPLPDTTTVTEPTYEPRPDTTTTTEPTTENPTNTTTTTTEPTTENPANTTTTTTTGPNTENPATTTTATTESNNENPATTTTTTGPNIENPATTTTATTESNNENPPVKEPTYPNGSDTQPQSNPAQPGTETDMRDAVKAKDDLNSAAGYGQKAAGEATQQEPPNTSTGTKSGTVGTPFGTPESNPSADTLNGPLEKASNDAGKRFDNSAPNIAAPQFVAPPTPTAAPEEQPLVIPDPMKNSPDVLELNNAQRQLQQVQAAAAQAEADYKAAGPNANMAPMLKAQAQLKGQQVFVKMLKEKVKAQLPRLPIGTGAATKGSAGSAGSQNQPSTKGQ